MVAVFDEVGLADLVEIDRRQLVVIEMRTVNALPAVAGLHLPRKERAVEVPVPADAPHHVIDGDGTNAPFALRVGTELLADFVEGQEGVVTAPEPAGDRSPERLAASASEVRAR